MLVRALRTLISRRMGLVFCSLLPSACARSSVYTTEDHQNISITPDALGQNGIAWEGYHGMSLSNDTCTEEGVTLQDMVREIAEDVIAVLHEQTGNKTGALP